MKVSVALCTFNGEKFLAEQLESILHQTYPVKEIVICDDRSTDGTIGIINKYREQHSHLIKFYLNDKNLGGKSNFEKAFGLTTGDVIFFSDQDDVWKPNKVEATLQAFAENPECLGAFSDGHLIDEKGESLGCSFWDSLNLDERTRAQLTKAGICFYNINFVNIVAGSMLAVKKECKPLVLPFKFLDIMWHDVWIAYVLSSVNKLAMIQETLIHYRQHSGQLIGAGSQEFKKEMQSYKMLADPEYQQQYPFLYFNHSWNTYIRVRTVEKELPSVSRFVPFLRERAIHAKMNLLYRQNFLLRKARIAKWFFRNEFETSFKDVLTL